MQVKKDFFLERSDKGQLILTPYALCARNSDKRGLSNIDDLRTIFTCQNGTVLEKHKKKKDIAVTCCVAHHTRCVILLWY